MATGEDGSRPTAEPAGDDGPGDREARGALLFVALAAAAVALFALLPVLPPPPPDSVDPETRTCRIDREALALAPGTTLFDGVFSPLPPEAGADVEIWTDIFRGVFADTFRAYLKRAHRWEARVAPRLRERGVPEDFLYLAMIESGFNTRAYSRFHAVGPWQFRRFTGVREGLEVSWDVDERRDPTASTTAAARHLQRLHRRFDDWALAAAGYNAGATRVRFAIRRAGGDADFWELSRRRLLPTQTRNYVPKLIAAARVAHDPAGTGFPGFVPFPDPPPPTETVEVVPGASLEAIARAAGLDPDLVRTINPHLVRGRAPSRVPARVRLPRAVVESFRARWAGIPSAERRGGTVHVVGRSETLGGIARTYGVPLRALLGANEDVEPRRLRVGQRLQVPVVR